MHRHDAGMIQVGDRARLSQIRLGIFGLRDQLGVRDFDGNRAIQLLIVSQPTWGVDVGAAAQIRAEILALRDAGCAVLVVSEELDELFDISDRLHVIAKGQLSPSLNRADASVELIGQWMSGLWSGTPSTEETSHVAS
jgi:ABC-type transporter Mla maintaining outer membrane lipid asymmetry ATPase subunit MlaF